MSDRDHEEQGRRAEGDELEDRETDEAREKREQREQRERREEKEKEARARLFTGEGGYASTERDQTQSRERVRGRPLDEAGEPTATDSDAEAGLSRRAERYED